MCRSIWSNPSWRVNSFPICTVRRISSPRPLHLISSSTANSLHQRRHSNTLKQLLGARHLTTTSKAQCFSRLLVPLGPLRWNCLFWSRSQNRSIPIEERRKHAARNLLCTKSFAWLPRFCADKCNIRVGNFLGNALVDLFIIMISGNHDQQDLVVFLHLKQRNFSFRLCIFHCSCLTCRTDGDDWLITRDQN